MRKLKLYLFSLALAAFLAGLATSEGYATQKTQYTAVGNNVGVTFGIGGTPMGDGCVHQFPRGSGNLFTPGRFGWGVMVLRDMNGDGIAEDTLGHGARGVRIHGMNSSLESYAELEACFNAGENMEQASTRIDHNRVLTSLDPEDLADWYPEFREGRVASGAPILHGAETVVVRDGDAFQQSDWAAGASMEYRFHLLNFAESNNMIYGHVTIRNMTEYIKWNPNPDIRDKVAGQSDGQVWKEWTFHRSIANRATIGDDDEAWGFHSPTAIHVIADRNGIESSFTGNPFMVANYTVHPPEFKGQKMHATNMINHNWEEEFGFDAVLEPLEQGFPYGKAYNMSKGKGYAEYAYEGNISPWNGQALYGWPGVLEPADSRYNQWLWGDLMARNMYQFWGWIEDFAPRDTCSADFVVMFLYGNPSNFAFPRSEIANIDRQDVQQFFAPVLEYADVARLTWEGGYVVPETPVPPPLTIIPGDRQVTITWSDVNVNTPDAYYTFLHEHNLDPDNRYVQYDFEGYRLYRSYVGPGDAHLDKDAEGNPKPIFQCSKSAGNIAYYYVDKKEADQPLQRMQNGQKVWYALVPYDKNYDPTTGVQFSLPLLSSGKVWNRSGPTGLYTVIPRSDASNFKSAELGAVTYSPADGGDVVEGTTVDLAGDGSGKLTEPPKRLMPTIKEISLVPVNNERLSADRTLYLTCSGMDAYDLECPGRIMGGVRSVEMSEGSFTSAAKTIEGGAADEQECLFQGPVSNAGIDYALTMSFQGLSYANIRNSLYYYIDPGTYTGGELYLPSARGCGIDVDPGAWPTNPAYVRSGQFQVTWKDAGGGELTLEVKDLTRNIDVPFTQYCDTYGWGFQIKADFGGEIGGSRRVGGYGNYFDQAFVKRIPQAERTVRMLDKMSSDNTLEFGLWVNGCFWSVSLGDKNGGDGITMPATGTVWTITNAFGTWNSDKTVFTQYPDMPFLGDRWTVEVKKSTLTTEDADLSKIRVVPNPYVASSFLDLSPDSRRVEFVNLPDRCTIRIYSMGGHLVNVLNHIGANRNGWGNYTDWDRMDASSQPMQLTGYDNHGGTEPWNLRNRFGTTIASGLYFYHVTDARGKTYTGKFYVIN